MINGSFMAGGLVVVLFSLDRLGWFGLHAFGWDGGTWEDQFIVE